MKSVQHQRQIRKEERAFHEYWERRQKEREKRKNELGAAKKMDAGRTGTTSNRD
jgi:hypothetical protein